MPLLLQLSQVSFGGALDGVVTCPERICHPDVIC